jgi:uncharacterized protein YecT (DUF1311 family)
MVNVGRSTEEASVAMKKWIAAGLVLFAGTLIVPMGSQDAPKKHPIDAWLDACLEKDPSTQGMLTCLGEAYRRWDAELNRVYGALLARLTAEEAAALREAQRAWLKQRDATFKLLDGVYGRKEGTMFLTMRAADRVDVVEKRTFELLSVLDVLDME